MTEQALPLRCDGCAVGPPATTFSLPRLTPLFGDMLSTGFYCLCVECSTDLEREGPGRRAALAIGRRMIDGNAQLARFHGDQRKKVVAALTDYLERILPLLTDARPWKDGEDPLQAKAVGGIAGEIKIWCPSCGRPMSKGETCHGHAY